MGNTIIARSAIDVVETGAVANRPKTGLPETRAFGV
jgi:hypothetical protein